MAAEPVRTHLELFREKQKRKAGLDRPRDCEERRQGMAQGKTFGEVSPKRSHDRHPGGREEKVKYKP